MWWSRFAVKFILRGRTPLAFQAVRIPGGQVMERFYLRNGENEIDVSQAHAVVSHEPFCIAVSMSHEQSGYFETGPTEALVFVGKRPQARLLMTPVKEMVRGSCHVYIFQVDKAFNFQIDCVRQKLLFWMLRTKNSPFEDKCYAAAFSFPRPVIVVSFRDGDYYNIFPMDFQCFLKAQNVYILGLRVTNMTLKKMLAVKKVVVGDTSDVGRDTLYALGRHHSTSPPPLSKLPFKTTDSERFGFPVPDFSASYKEIELLGDYQLGTHTVMVGKVMNTVEKREQQSSIYHIHTFHALVSRYPGT